ncbi:MAG TPA: AAA family ATPase, partial [Phycisphaerae bacterium]|nr:AAA family ATPase [Phycisphaerae bacterium]
MNERVVETELARERVESFIERVRAIRQSLHQVVVGQDETIDLLLVCALTGSHALLVGVPGLAKTLMVKALAAVFRWKFNRIQFTPDLMPSDITGYELLGRDGQQSAPTMVFRPGPVFANLVLADEINRAAPKTQSALLEAMAERHVTVGGQTHPLTERGAHWAALAGAAVFALTPAATLMFRFNNPDALLVFTMVLAAYCTVRAGV